MQKEVGLDTISNQTALNWLKAERPKTVIYPHQTDYCDYYSKVKLEIQACQQRITRHLQSGAASSEDIEELKKNKIWRMIWMNTEKLLEIHFNTITT